jgi:hypothetical protein
VAADTQTHRTRKFATQINTASGRSHHKLSVAHLENLKNKKVKKVNKIGKEYEEGGATSTNEARERYEGPCR